MFLNFSVAPSFGFHVTPQRSVKKRGNTRKKKASNSVEPDLRTQQLLNTY